MDESISAFFVYFSQKRLNQTPGLNVLEFVLNPVQADSSKIVGVNSSELSGRDANGIHGGIYMKHRLNLMEKSELLESFRKGTAVFELCKSYNVPRSTAYRWIAQDHSEPKPRASRSLRLICMDLERTIGKLKNQLAILRELSPLSEAPAIEKTAVVQNLKTRFPIKALCEALELRKSSY